MQSVIGVGTVDYSNKKRGFEICYNAVCEQIKGGHLKIAGKAIKKSIAPLFDCTKTSRRSIGSRLHN